MRIGFRSIREGDILGMLLVFPDGSTQNVIMARMPSDGDWRADVEFYDNIEKAYKKRLHSAFRDKT